MIKSMTGFGTAKAETDKVEIIVEIKSLNSKFLDAGLRLPKEYADKDIEIRNILNQTIERGKVNFSIELESKSKEAKAKVAINRELVKQYYKDLKETAAFIGAPDNDLFKLA